MMICRAFGLFLMLSTPAAAQTITIKVVSRTGVGVESKVLHRTGDITSTVRTERNGELTLSGITCASNRLFKVEPPPGYAQRDRNWQPCKTALLFELIPMLTASIPSWTLGDQPIASAQATPEIRATQTELAIAATAGDLPQLASLANKQAASYRALGETETANRYSGLAIHTGLEVIAAEMGVAPPASLHALPSGRLEETQSANDLLKRWQQRNGLAPKAKPAWDYKTFEALNDRPTPSVTNIPPSNTSATPYRLESSKSLRENNRDYFNSLLEMPVPSNLPSPAQAPDRPAPPSRSPSPASRRGSSWP